MLVGNTFYQDSSLDPGTGYPMYYWHQTNTGLVYIRNTKDSAWVFVGDANQPSLGQLSTQGGTMNGAISGAHGLSPDNSNDFDTLYVGGVAVPGKTYIDDQIAAINASVASSVAAALSAIPSLSLSSRVARAKGSWTTIVSSTGNVIPLPVYSDGVQASEADCFWGVAAVKWQMGHVQSTAATFSITETAPRIYSISIDSGGAGGHMLWDWWIIGFRSS